MLRQTHARNGVDDIEWKLHISLRRNVHSGSIAADRWAADRWAADRWAGVPLLHT